MFDNFCHICQETDIALNIEAFELSGNITCDDCAEEIFEKYEYYSVEGSPI